MYKSEGSLNDQAFISNDDFLKLKEIFEKEINSKRAFEEISTFEELMSVLEDREELTQDVLLKLEPNLQNFVQSRLKNSNRSEELILPESVLRLLEEDLQNDWDEMGTHLLKRDQMCRCGDIETVLSCFVENCKGISRQEMIFRLTRSLEKCGKIDLKSRVLALIENSL